MTAMNDLKSGAYMRMNLLTLGVGLVLTGMAVSAGYAADPSLKTLHDNMPAIVSRLTATGQVPATNDLDLVIGLPLRNKEAMTNLLREIYDPASTNYHRYLTPQEFTAQFGPTEQDYQKVESFAKANGLTITGVHPNRMLLNVQGTAAAVEKAFRVQLHTYRHPSEARNFFAPDSEPSLDASLPIVHVSGLDNYASARPMIKAHPTSQMSMAAPSASAQSLNASPNLGSAPGGNYEGQDFRNAYVPGTSLTGAGQNVGLFQLDGFYPSDITAYEQQIGLTANVPNLVVVPVDGGVPTPTPFGNPEVSLDIEMVLSMSPGVSNIYVYEGPNSSSASIYTIFEDVFNRMANDNLAKQLSCSWYIVNGFADPISEQIFQQMALQGQSLFCASGDSDAYTGLIPFPCDSPHVTLVGGTTLTTGANASYTSETVWNWGIEYGNDGVGSSGGISTYYTIPSWQTSISTTANKGSATMRNVPDVALTGDHIWVIYGAGSSDWFGGTSCAAPLWAGFTALVNQQAASNHLAPVGFLNPALYAIAASTNYTNCFHDVSTGNDTWSGSPNLFYAVTNYDLCTGLGTPNGTNLINALSGVVITNTITHISAPLPPYGTTLSGMNGSNPNGTWELFIQDNMAFNSGAISNGWILTLTTANPVGYAGNLTLAMTPSASFVLAGSNLSYTITVTNYGPSVSSNVVVSDSFIGANFVSATATLGSVTRSGSTFVWTAGTLNVGSGAQLVLTLQAENVSSTVNSAIARADTADPNSADNSETVSVNVGLPSPPQMAVVKTNGAFSLSIGGSALSTVVQASTNLVNWTPVYTSTPPFTFTDPNATNYRYRFYRAVQ